MAEKGPDQDVVLEGEQPEGELLAEEELPAEGELLAEEELPAEGELLPEGELPEGELPPAEIDAPVEGELPLDAPEDAPYVEGAEFARKSTKIRLDS